MTTDIYEDRRDAGRRLAKVLSKYKGREDVVILGLARGGIVVAAEVARMLDVPFDIFVVRKLGGPGRPEVAMGAIAPGGVKVLHRSLISSLGVRREQVDEVIAEESREMVRRESLYRAGRPPVHLGGRTVILVDDGLATGATLEAAASSVRRQKPAAVVVAVPVAPRSARDMFKDVAEEFACPLILDNFDAIGRFYADFSPVEDDAVLACLHGRVSR